MNNPDGTILDARGRPYKVRELTRELAAPVDYIRPIWHDPVAESLTPTRLAELMRAAKQDDATSFLTLAEEMEERDLHYSTVLGTRKLAVEGLTPMVRAAEGKPEYEQHAEAIEKLIEADEFGDLVSGLLDAIAKGFAVVEIMWERGGNEWRPEAYEWRDPRHFRFDFPHSEELRLRDEKDLMRGIPLAPFKFVVHYPRRRQGLKIASGLARLAAVAYMCKAYTLRGWMRFMEVYGLPLRVGRYGPGAKKEDIDILKRAVINLGSDAAAVLPKDMLVEFVDVKVPAGGENLFRGLADWWDSQVSKGVLGQTMTTDDGSSLSQAQVHNEVRLDIREADAKGIGRTIGKYLVQPYIDLNFGPQKAYPKVVFPVEEGADIAALSTALASLIPQGLKISQQWVRDKIGAPAPDEEDELMGAPVSGTNPPPDGTKPPDAGKDETKPGKKETKPATDGTKQEPLEAARNREGEVSIDALDELLEDSLSDWEPLMEGTLSPLREALNRSSSLEDFRDQLPGLLDEIDEADLTDALARALFKARGIGDSPDAP